MVGDAEVSDSLGIVNAFNEEVVRLTPLCLKSLANLTKDETFLEPNKISLTIFRQIF